MLKYIYPQLSLKPAQDFGFFRLGGPGLANCLFVAARAYLKAKDLKCEMLRPTWERLSIGQIIRREKDKRLYRGLFKDESIWMKLRKAWLIRFGKDVATEEGVDGFFEDIIDRHAEVREWFYNAINSDVIKGVPTDMSKSVAVHVRLGDFPSHYRVPVSWYAEILRKLQHVFGDGLDIQVFSDGSDEELSELLCCPRVRRVFYGNALADIVAISRCGLLVAGKYSTFSAWGAYLGNVPSIFQEIDYGRVVPNGLEVRLGQSTDIPESFLKRVEANFNEA